MNCKAASRLFRLAYKCLCAMVKDRDNLFRLIKNEEIFEVLDLNAIRDYLQKEDRSLNVDDIILSAYGIFLLDGDLFECDNPYNDINPENVAGESLNIVAYFKHDALSLQDFLPIDYKGDEAYCKAIKEHKEFYEEQRQRNIVKIEKLLKKKGRGGWKDISLSMVESKRCTKTAINNQ